MLSQEDRNALSPEQILAALRDANIAARRLASSLIKGERCEDPKAHLNAPNPAHGVHIRLLRPQPTFIGYDVDKVREHNEYVSSLGVSGTRFGS
jgi:hypothetical protein